MSALRCTGLPGAIDAAKLKGILQLTKQHRRIISAELHRQQPSLWTDREPDEEQFYESLLALLHRADGLDSWENAVRGLEGAVKPKRCSLVSRLCGQLPRHWHAHIDPDLPRSLDTDQVGTVRRVRDALADRGERDQLVLLLWSNLLLDFDREATWKYVQDDQELSEIFASVQLRDEELPVKQEADLVAAWPKAIAALQAASQELDAGRPDPEQADRVVRLAQAVADAARRAGAAEQHAIELEGLAAEFADLFRAPELETAKYGVVAGWRGGGGPVGDEARQLLDALASALHAWSAAHEEESRAQAALTKLIQTGEYDKLQELAGTAGAASREAEAVRDQVLALLNRAGSREEGRGAKPPDEPDRREAWQPSAVEETAEEAFATRSHDVDGAPVVGGEGGGEVSTKEREPPTDWTDDASSEPEDDRGEARKGIQTADDLAPLERHKGPPPIGAAALVRGGRAGDGGSPAVAGEAVERTQLVTPDKLAELPEHERPFEPERPVEAEPRRHPAEEEDHRLDLSRSCFELIVDGRAGLAWHHARLAQETRGAGMAAIARLCAASELEVGAAIVDAETLTADVATLLGDLERADPKRLEGLALALASAGAAIWPTAFLTGVEATPVLQRAARMLQEGQLSPGFAELTEALGELRARHMLLTPELLARTVTRENREQRIAQAAAEVADWLEAERRSTLTFHAATVVWHSWLARREPLGELLGVVAADRREHASQVRELIAGWHTPATIEGHIDQTDRLRRRHRARTDRIVGSARHALHQKAASAVAKAETWLALVEEMPRNPSDYHQELAARFHGVFQRSAPQAESELEELANGEAVIASAARLAKGLLIRFAQRFEGLAVRGLDVPLDARLNADLLASSRVRLGPDWQLAEPEESALGEEVAQLVTSPPPDWRAVLGSRCVAGDHVSSRHMLHWLEQGSVLDPDALDQLRAARQESLAAWRGKLTGRRRIVGDRVEGALALGVIGEAERATLLAELEAIAAALDSDDPAAREDFYVLAEKLEAIERALVERRQARKREIYERLESESFRQADPGALDRIRRALEQDQIPVAVDYLERVEQRLPLPPEHDIVTPRVERFWALLAPELLVVPQGAEPEASIHNIMAVVRGQEGVDDDATSEGERLIDAWVRIRSATRDLPEQLKLFLESIGFTNVRVHGTPRTPGRRDQEADYAFEARPIRDREICPVPAFGSDAGGRYRVLVVRGRSSVEAVLEAVNRIASGDPLMVVFAGGFGREDRFALRTGCHQRRASCLVVDDYLVAFLAGISGGRLSTMFECTLPFTWAEPYVRQLPLPPEMFYGRNREQRAIVSRTGDVAYLVYGGRQLGKTAILRQIVDQYDADTERVVRYVDLKAAEVGSEPERIWKVVSGVLTRAKVLAGSVKSQKMLISETVRWLDARSGRSILLLLDEADAFLEADARSGYRQIAQIKDLIAGTQVRFKVVFAGLHNVQRASRDPNTPIAHLGTPLPMGPLLQDEERNAAWDLITRPFAALGYRPESADVVTRILTHTNYYPSLIQIFCFHLLQHLHRYARSRGSARFPVPVTMEDIEEVLLGRQLIHEIKHRFELTTRLDPRYEAIALLTAQLCRDDLELLVNGLSVEELREFCREHWPEGFVKDDSFEGFKALLDELVDLGVLRAVSPDHYALRNPNVLTLLGTSMEISRKLEDIKGRPPPKDFDPGLFRVSLDGKRQWRRSPLTGHQQASLLKREPGIVLMWGTRLGGLAEAATGIRFAVERTEEWDRQSLPLNTTLADIKGRLRRELRTTKDEHRLLVLGSDAAWAPDWIGPLLETIGQRPAPGRCVRLVAIGDPVVCWQWFQTPDLHDRLRGDQRIAELFLGPWSRGALEQLQIDELDLLRGGLGEANLDELTGRWGPLLALLAETAPGRPVPERRNHYLEALRPREWLADVLDIPQFHLLAATLAELGEADDIEGLASIAELETNLVWRACEFGLSLGLLRGSLDQLRLDPILARALREGAGDT